MLIAATDWHQVSAIAESATAAAAFLALVGAGLQLAQNRRQARATRAHQYLERWGDPHEIALNAKLIDFIEAEPHAQAARRAHWNALSREDRLEILHGLNFWEEMAGMYRRGLLNRKIVRDYFGGPAISYWRWSIWFISYQREKQDSDALMAEFGSLCAEIARGREAAKRKMTFPYARQLHGRSRPPGLPRLKDTKPQKKGAGPLEELYRWQERVIHASSHDLEQMLEQVRRGHARPVPSRTDDRFSQETTDPLGQLCEWQQMLAFASEHERQQMLEALRSSFGSTSTTV